MAYKKFSKKTWEKAKQYYETNMMSAITISDKYGIPQSSLFYRIKKEGWKIGNASPPSLEEIPDKIAETLVEIKSLESETQSKPFLKPYIKDKLEAVRKQLELLEALTQIVKGGINLHSHIVLQTLNGVKDKTIHPLVAARIVANLGLNVANIAKMAGIETLTHKPITDDESLESEEVVTVQFVD